MEKVRCTFFTSTRADYGLIAPVVRAMGASSRYKPSYIVSGTHLSFDYGHTIDEIDTRHAPITATLQTLITDDERHLDVPGTLSVTIQETALFLRQHEVDLLFVAGDRYEVFGAAIAANLTNTPLAHLYGGDISHGAYDDSFRHAITKFAHLHFTTNDSSAQRVVQMGEDPAHVHCVGSPALDTLAEFKAMNTTELSHALGIDLSGDYFLVSIHPATRENLSAKEQVESILNALNAYAKKHAISYIFTMPGADDGGSVIANTIKAHCHAHTHAHFFHSFAHTHYLSLMKHSSGVIGNSSSGLYEAPSFKIPTLNIGSRQEGRLRADSVINCSYDSATILTAMEKLRKLDTRHTVNPYGRGNASQQIVSILDTYDSFKPLIMKPFHMLPPSVLPKIAVEE
jgi:UDP-hydrolysing UDP-N-acetyl-D-glucosamine 2-epimerase